MDWQSVASMLSACERAGIVADSDGAQFLRLARSNLRESGDSATHRDRRQRI